MLFEAVRGCRYPPATPRALCDLSDILMLSPLRPAVSLDWRLCPGDGVDDETSLSRVYIAVRARWTGGEGVEVSSESTDEGDLPCRLVRARDKFPSIVLFWSAHDFLKQRAPCRDIPSSASSHLRGFPRLSG